eukprot:TRINITY_DN110363_c0_g1_i1.p1 TRINITY_DN110363_c0_g1~~TRINITY_DN110363_c0_g1_i1.p1  ORF type:complete len:114 (-),score=14.05 TRINITY_DN110363_c0_g1_i1:320-661(-)
MAPFPLWALRMFTKHLAPSLVKVNLLRLNKPMVQQAMKSKSTPETSKNAQRSFETYARRSPFQTVWSNVERCEEDSAKERYARSDTGHGASLDDLSESLGRISQKHRSKAHDE